MCIRDRSIAVHFSRPFDCAIDGHHQSKHELNINGGVTVSDHVSDRSTAVKAEYCGWNLYHSTVLTNCDTCISVKLIFVLMVAINGTVEISAEMYSIGPQPNILEVENNLTTSTPAV